ncbi:MAG: MYXO-CTERM sorting domain-containing protein [Myxococcota bacterium]
MPANLLNLPPISSFCIALGLIALPNAAIAGPGAGPGAGPVVQNPSYDPAPAPVVIDFSAGTRNGTGQPRVTQTSKVRFDQLDDYRREVEPSAPSGDIAGHHSLPEGLAQVGGMVVPEAMLDGAAMVGDATATLTPGADPQYGGPDLSEICAFPEEVPPGIYDYDHRPGGETPRFHTVYLNFTGEPDGLFTGGENAAENLSNIARSGHPYPVYGGGEEKAIAAAQAVAADFEDWAVRVVYIERPPKVLPYSMVMVGGHHSDTTAGPSGGVAPLDCEDFGQRNVCYAFQNGAPATSQANVISQEIGHTLGLGHTNASDSVMAAGYAPTQGGDLGFNETCAPIIQVQGQGAACIGVNRCHCGVPDAQHDWQTLSTTFAPAGPDTTEPTIALLQPEDGAVFEPEDTIRVEFDPWDDVGGYGWGLRVSDDSGELLYDQVDYERALIFDLIGLPAGEYTLTAYIQDHADHVSTDEVTIRIGGAEGLDDSGGEGGMGMESDGPPMTTGATSDGEGSDDDAGLDDANANAEGCDCTSGDPLAPSSAVWALGLWGLIRRRRTGRGRARA